MHFLKRFKFNFAALLMFCGLAAGCSNATPEELIANAKAYLQKGETASAVIELKNALQINPRNGKAKLLLGNIYISTGELPLALRELEGALDSGVEKSLVKTPLLSVKNRQGRFREVLGELEGELNISPELQVILGEAYLAAGDPKKARKSFNIVIQQQPENGKATLGLALAALLDGDRAQAQIHFLEASKWSSTDQNVWLQKGNFELANQQSEKALHSFRTALSLDGGEQLANLGIARTYIALGNAVEAEEAIDRVLDLTNKIPVAHYIKAQLLFQRNEFVRSEKVLKRVLKLVPNYTAALYLKAAIDYQQGSYALAENSLRSLLKDNPENMQVLLLLSTTQLKAGDARVALATLEPYKDQLQSAKALALLGTIYLQNGQHEKANRSLEAALAMAPDNSEIRTQLALGYLNSGDSDRAVNELQKAVVAGGKDTRDDALLVLVKMRSGKLTEALEAAKAFQARHPESVIAYNLLGAAHMALADTDAAKTAFSKAVQLDSAYSPATFNLAKMARSSGDTEGARSLYANFLKTNPKSIEGHVGLGQLELESGNLDAALESFTQAARIDEQINGKQKVANIPLQIGLVQLKKEDLSAARAFFEKALGVSDGKSKQALLALIQLEGKAGNRDKARLFFDELYLLMPDSGAYHVMLGNFELEGGDLSAAERNYQKAVDLKFRDGTFRYAHVMATKNRLEKAVSLLEEWTADNKLDLAAQAMLGSYYLKQENGQSAVKIYKFLSTQSQDNAAILNNLAWAYHLSGDTLAEATARRAHELDPGNIHMTDTLAWILVQNGDVAGSLVLFDEALISKHDNASVYYHAAVAYSRSRRISDAQDSLRKALDLGVFPERAKADILAKELKI